MTGGTAAPRSPAPGSPAPGDADPADPADPAGRTAHWRRRVRAAMPVEGDLAFRRRCETVLEFLGAGPGDHVLDAGCGYGYYLRLVPALTGARITGVDLDPDRVASAAARLADDDRVTVVTGSLTDLPFPDATFSHVVCSEVLEHLPDDAAALRELARVLRPGGRLVLTVPAADFPLGWDPPNWLLRRLTAGHVQLRGERPWSGIWYGHRRLYDAAGLAALVERAGFTVAETRRLSHRVPPFAHLVLYGTLKPLLMRGWLPGGVAAAGDRLAAGAAPARSGAVARAAMAVLGWIDRPNDDPAYMERRRACVAIALRADLPDGGGA